MADFELATLTEWLFCVLVPYSVVFLLINGEFLRLNRLYTKVII
jgi:hypothetical protein